MSSDMKTTSLPDLDVPCSAASSRDQDVWRVLLDWHVALGVDEVIGEVPVNAFEREDPKPSFFSAPELRCDTMQHQDAPSSSAKAASPALPHQNDISLHPAGPARSSARLSVKRQPVTNDIRPPQAVATCESLVDLQHALEQFEGCPLKRTASNTVFADGNPHADLMIIGEAPGRDEDREGVPFVGASGQLLDRMLASIGQSRETFYITNLLPWRPPGNRAPTDSEVTACLPFLVRHIELVQPKILLLVGGLAAKNLFARSEGITRLRGQWRTWTSPNMPAPIPSLATFHPAYLLRTPVQKRLAWRDLLEVKLKLRTVGVS